MINRVYLLGFMGSGKTTIGRQLSRDLQWKFIDLDDYIEQREGLSIKEIFAQKGEEGFRRIETQALTEIAHIDGAVIAAGGGTPCFGTNMDTMRASGLTIYINVAPADLASRLRKAKDNRPLIAQKTDDELLGYITQKLQEREPFYRRAHMAVDGQHVPFSTYAQLVRMFPESEL